MVWLLLWLSCLKVASMSVWLCGPEDHHHKEELKLAHICIVVYPQTYLIKYSKEVVGTLRARSEGGISTDKWIVAKGSAVYIVEGAKLLVGRILPKYQSANQRIYSHLFIFKCFLNTNEEIQAKWYIEQRTAETETIQEFSWALQEQQCYRSKVYIRARCFVWR